MMNHLREAYSLTEEMEPFELEEFKELGQLAAFYAAKGNVQYMDDICNKCEAVNT